ncbi:hypothetical protein [Roseibium litorale]|uniref:Uncharacterized protein n=1 Tax=Roseibium litorale TaxID=2803841 RepID=A0ABR9CNP3_9HYPH|nr:hypothetical protein [Roseibium litorale]MBD8892045.1 hypothetical protein [Roseibium litorale]
MPTSVDRPQGAQVVPHATEYPPDRERQRHAFPRPEDAGGHDREAREETSGPQDEDPAVVLETEHFEDHRLDGVAAYRATAHKVLDPVPQPADQKRAGPHGDVQPPSVVRHAYEEHGGEIEHHEVNVAT